MLELAATAWVYAMAITTALFLSVLVVQGVVRHVRSAARAVQRVAQDVVEAAPSSRSELVDAGVRAS